MRVELYWYVTGEGKKYGLHVKFSIELPIPAWVIVLGYKHSSPIAVNIIYQSKHLVIWYLDRI